MSRRDPPSRKFPALVASQSSLLALTAFQVRAGAEWYSGSRVQPFGKKPPKVCQVTWPPSAVSTQALRSVMIFYCLSATLRFEIADIARAEELRYTAEKYGRVRDVYVPKDYYTGYRLACL